MRPLMNVLTIAVAALMWSVVAAYADERVVVQSGGVEPPVLHTTTGSRVDFENRTGRAIHLEFEGDGGRHEVVQVPATGPFWVVFHRTGTHRYVVHVYEAKERTLPGLVEVTENAQRPTETPACGVAVMGICVER